MLRYILPNIADEVVVLGTLWLATAVRTEASLSFIGLGVRPPTPTWGGIIRDGFENMLDSLWLVVMPSLAILAVMIALNMIGDGLRDARRSAPAPGMTCPTGWSRQDAFQ